MSDEVTARLKTFLEEFIPNLKECRDLIERNKIFINRCEGVGYISKEDAVGIGLTGPNLRASGVSRDLRREEPYLIYDKLDFDVPVFTEGDCLARYYVRVGELYESVKILNQCLQKIPNGEIEAKNHKQVLPGKQNVYTKMEDLINDFMLVNFGNIPP